MLEERREDTSCMYKVGDPHCFTDATGVLGSQDRDSDSYRGVTCDAKGHL